MTENVAGTETAEAPRSTRRPPSTQCPFAPPPGLLDLHDSGKPVVRARTWDGSTPWVVTRHAALGEILADPRVSANIGGPGYPHTTEAMKAHAAEMQPPTAPNTPGGAGC
ncbi:hypothetical protein [Streptomyces mirabilis]|uniref:hypothetical protein n=1 Tax=Streptomyces mirabilis TaxID=68239 RepID=UPI00343975A6